jgi:prophage regulatory protein
MLMPTSEQRAANIPTPAELAQLPDDTLIPQRDVLEIIRVSRTSWWRGVKSGIYPQPVKMGARMNRWHLGKIREIVRSGL